MPKVAARKRHSTKLLSRGPNGKLSFGILLFCWLGFLILHLVCFIFFAAMAWGYWNLPGTLLEAWLDYFHISWSSKHDHIVAVVHGCIAVMHIVFIMWMTIWSLIKKEMVFAVYNLFTRSTASISKGRKKSLKDLLMKIVSKIGLIGINGPYFDLMLLVREIVETALQTNQAYRMSKLIARPLLSRGYVILLVLNCWSTSLVHFLFHSNEPKRRFYAIVCDSVLDMVTSVGITTALIFIYAKDFDFQLTGFPTYMWYKSVWAVHAFSEFQIILVTSGGDLAMRVVFALSMISNMNNMKKLLSANGAPTQTIVANAKPRTVAVAPLSFKVSETKPHTPTKRPHKGRSFFHWVLHTENLVTQVLFLVWGAIILALQLYAESVPSLSQCKMQCKPWFNSLPSCSLLVVDCYDLGGNGTEAETSSQWESIDTTTTVSIVIRHCPTLEVPPALNQFSSIRVLKIYNSTIASWGDSSALTQTHHPKLMMLYLVRVNFTNGELPTGLLSAEFPQKLTDIEFCITNLRTVPDDFDTKWPRYATIYLEAGEFTEVPPPLARLAPYDFSVAMNPILQIPAEIFASHVLYVNVGGTLVSQLPENVTDAESLMQIRVDSTNLSFFWSWVDPALAYTGIEPPHTIVNEPVIAATNTPYCSELQRVFSGEQSLLPYHENQSPILSNTSVGNWPLLQVAVGCEPRRVTWYPIEYEDIYSAIQPS